MGIDVDRDRAMKLAVGEAVDGRQVLAGKPAKAIVRD